MGMKYLILAVLIASKAGAQAPEPASVPAPAGNQGQGPIITWADGNDQSYYGYNDYSYGGGYYGYGGGYGGRGRDWNNYSDGRYENRGNHRGADRARGGGGGGGRR